MRDSRKISHYLLIYIIPSYKDDSLEYYKLSIIIAKIISLFLIFNPMEVLLLYFLFVNIIVFILAGYDKYQARKNKQRIPQNTLFFLEAIGGTIGLLLAMLLFRHKTSKTSFIVKFTIIFLIQLVLVYLKVTNKV